MSPSQSIVAGAATNVVHEFFDSRGRRIAWKSPSFLDQVRLLRAIGADQASNETYVGIVNVACSVASIDGVPVPRPTNERQIDAAIGSLGDEGIAAILAFMAEQKRKAAADAAAALAGDAPADPLSQSGTS